MVLFGFCSFCNYANADSLVLPSKKFYSNIPRLIMKPFREGNILLKSCKIQQIVSSAQHQAMKRYYHNEFGIQDTNILFSPPGNLRENAQSQHCSPRILIGSCV